MLLGCCHATPVPQLRHNASSASAPTVSKSGKYPCEWASAHSLSAQCRSDRWTSPVCVAGSSRCRSSSWPSSRCCRYSSFASHPRAPALFLFFAPLPLFAGRLGLPCPPAAGRRVSRQVKSNLSLHAGPSALPGRRPHAPALRFLKACEGTAITRALKARTA